MDISNRHSQQDFAQSFDFHFLTNFAKGISLLCKASLRCVLLRKWPFKPQRVIDKSHYGTGEQI